MRSILLPPVTQIQWLRISVTNLRILLILISPLRLLLLLLNTVTTPLQSSPAPAPQSRVELNDDAYTSVKVDVVDYDKWAKAMLDRQVQKLKDFNQKVFEPFKVNGENNVNMNPSNKVLLSFLADEHPNQNMLDTLIKRLKNCPEFNTKELASSTQQLINSTKSHIRTTKMYSAKSNKVKYYFRSVMDSIQQLLNLFFDEMIWEYQENNGVIEGPMNSLGVLEYQRKKDALEKALHNDKKYRMILPYFFLDDYNLYLKRKTSATGMYMSLVNLKFLLKNPEDSIIRIAILPQNVDIDEVIKRIIVYPLLELEKGLELEVRGEKMNFIGSLFCILGDHKGLDELGGFTSASSKSPCRLSNSDRRGQAIVQAPYSKIRDPLEALAILTAKEDPKNPFRCKSALQELKTNAGLLYFSSLWTLGWYRHHFFIRKGLCYLVTLFNLLFI